MALCYYRRGGERTFAGVSPADVLDVTVNVDVTVTIDVGIGRAAPDQPQAAQAPGAPSISAAISGGICAGQTWTVLPSVYLCS